MVGFDIRLKGILTERNITQQDIADATGITAATISRYVCGERKPTAEVLGIIASSLGVSADYLLGLSPPSANELSPKHLRLIELFETASMSRRIQQAVIDILEEYTQAISMTVETTVKKKYEDERR